MKVSSATLKAVWDNYVAEGKVANTRMMRGLLFAVSAALLMLVVVFSRAPEQVTIPFLEIKLPTLLASLVFLLGSTVLGVVGVLKFRKGLKSVKIIGQNADFLSKEECDDLVNHMIAHQSSPTAFTLPGLVLVPLCAFILHTGTWMGLFYSVGFLSESMCVQQDIWPWACTFWGRLFFSQCIGFWTFLPYLYGVVHFLLDLIKKADLENSIVPEQVKNSIAVKKL